MDSMDITPRIGEFHLNYEIVELVPFASQHSCFGPRPKDLLVQIAQWNVNACKNEEDSWDEKPKLEQVKFAGTTLLH
jgi:hypothetical protein